MNSDTGTTSYSVADVLLEIPNAMLNERMRKAFSSGGYEASETRFLKNCIEPGEIVLELGAGVGFISTIVGRHPQTAAVHAVEANPKLIPVIKRTHALNGVTATVYNEVLGPRDGTTDFSIAHSFIASSVSGVWGGTKIQVPMTRFQKRLDDIRPTMLIVDIEGGENSLFDGVRLDTVRRIMIEVHQDVIGLEGIKHVFDTLSTDGFSYNSKFSTGHVVTFTRV